MTTPQLLPDRRPSSFRNEPVALAPASIEAISRAHAFAPAASSVALYGETGTGKTYFAEYIHRLSRRAGGFHECNLGSVAPQLAPDALFGHVKGAFTDAHSSRAGWLAEGLLLDDMQTVDLGVQARLLQVLDRRKYSPLGLDRVVSVACRIILAMTDDPHTLMTQGVLLKDLRYRFGMCAIRMAPLRERREEIPLLAQRALERCPEVTAVDGPTRFSKGALAMLCEGEWGGNVRELEGVVELAYLLARAAGRSEIGVEHLPENSCALPRYQPHGDPEANWIAVQRAVMTTGGNISAAAILLGISRTRLNALLASHQTGFGRTRKRGR